LRTEETNTGSLIADLLRTELMTDFSLYNSGAIRANSIINQGIINMKFVA
jgi:hypothetical protein